MVFCIDKRHMMAWALASACGAAIAQVGERVKLDGLGGFWIDKTEVTIGQFRQYVQATGAVTQAEREGGGFEYAGGWQRRPGWTWRRPDGTESASPDLPAVHLTHTEASRYCAWAGGRLPSTTEWREAGFTEQRQTTPPPWVRGQRYPWATGTTTQGANSSDPDPWPRAAPVTQTRAGVNGLHDMTGNGWEWGSEARGTERRTLGSSWWYPASEMTADLEAWKPQDFYAVYIGLRCVYDRHPTNR